MKLLKKKIEKREKKLKGMGVGNEQALKRKLHEESLLAQRLMVFLLVNSILFVGFTTLLRNQAQKLIVALPIIGIIACLLLIPHTLGVKVELGALDKLLKEEERSYAGRNVGFWVAVFFLIIWGMAIAEVICQ